VEEHICAELKDGAKLSDVYISAVNMVKSESPDLVDKLTKNFGFAMGIEFREGSLSITPNCTAVAKKGMIFNVNLGLTGLVNNEASDSKGKDVALFVGDTVMVNDGSPATILTPSKKKIKNIAIFLKVDDFSDLSIWGNVFDLFKFFHFSISSRFCRFFYKNTNLLKNILFFSRMTAKMKRKKIHFQKPPGLSAEENGRPSLTKNCDKTRQQKKNENATRKN
jgi:hypothetical protein